jgi:hypothetical protein
MMKSEEPPSILSLGTSNSWQKVSLALFCFALALFAYKGVVNKAFLGDDHVHLIWLRKAVADPSLVLHNFYSNWLYAGTTPQCYRPMISVFMYTDFLLWHNNAVGFHITNLLFLLIGTISLYGCVSEVLLWSLPTSDKQHLSLWPTLAAATFLLYPSHPEAVSWITGRVDSVVTAFYLASIYYYMVWRRTNHRTTMLASIALALASFASKEMAVTIPVTCFLFELLKPPGELDVRSQSSLKILKYAIMHSLSMWLILAGYFLLRKMALGTFVGGYDDSLSIDPRLLVQQWVSGLQKLFIPLNSYYTSQAMPLEIIWIFATATIYAISFKEFFNQHHRRQLMFFFLFFVVSLLPVYKLFNGLPDLEGSRFSYLASAPLAAFFAYGIAFIPSVFKRNRIMVAAQYILMLGYFVCAASMLWLNNQPWVIASRWELALAKDMNDILSQAKKGQRFAFFNIPNNYRGAYLARNAIGDIGQHQDLDWEAIEPGDRHQELGQLRQKITREHNVHCFFWCEGTGTLDSVTLPPENDENANHQLDTWNASPLSNRCKIIQGRERVLVEEHAESTPDLIAVKAGVTPLMVLLDMKNMSTWRCEFLRLHMENSTKGLAGNNVDSTSLILSNRYMSATLVQPSLANGLINSNKEDGQRELLFSTRSMPSWFCTDQAATAVLLFPPAWSGKFSLYLEHETTTLPSFRRAGAKRDISGTRAVTVLFDTSHMPGAKSTLVQISKKNECFKYQNTSDFESSCTYKIIPLKTSVGSLNLRYEDFAGDGQYQLRCWAVDAKGKIIGVSSDYLFYIVQRNG